MTTTLIQFAYLVAAVLFILGLRNLSSPKTATLGNQMAAVGMLVVRRCASMRSSKEAALGPAVGWGGLARCPP